MGYQALYRTWRPEKFSDVVGQERVVTTLLNQLRTGRTPHAYLFCGSRGTGKTSMAKILARAVNCLNPQDGEPCGQCAVCRAIAEESCLDVIEIDAASNNGVENVRELIEKIAFPPTMGARKVYIIDEVHMLSTSAFNALLKTLEEPPAYALFILATTDPQKLPATIVSRCQRFDFRRIPAALIEERLITVLQSLGASYDEAAVSHIARSAEGGLRDALSVLDMALAYASGGRLTDDIVREVLGSGGREAVFDFAGALIEGDAARAFDLIDRLLRSGGDPDVFAREVASHFRSLMVALLCGDEAADVLETTHEDVSRLRDQAQGVPQARLSRMMSLFLQAENDMKWSSQQRSVLELCAVRACHPEREAGGEALEDRLSRIEEALASGVVAARAEKAASKAETPAPKPAQQAEKPLPKAATSETNAGAEEKYKAGLKAVSKQEPRTWVLLNKGKFSGFDGAVVFVEYTEDGSEALIDIISKPEKAQLIDACMSEAFGCPVHLKADRGGKKPERAFTAQGKANIEKALSVFPRERIEYIDD